MFKTKSFTADEKEYNKLKKMLKKHEISISKIIRDAIRVKIKELENDT